MSLNPNKPGRVYKAGTISAWVSSAIVVAIAGYILLGNSPLLDVEELEVYGLHQVTLEQVEDRLGFQIGDPLPWGVGESQRKVEELPWVKRCIDLDDEKWENASDTTREALIYGIRSGDIWLNKIKHDKNGERIYGNVCLEVYLPSRGTCLLQHVNLGSCTLDNLQEAFVSGMSELCDLHGRTGVGESGEYLTPEIDRQVGLGVLGLANFLRRYNISNRKKCFRFS